jgi:hypothetical protein
MYMKKGFCCLGLILLFSCSRQEKLENKAIVFTSNSDSTLSPFQFPDDEPATAGQEKYISQFQKAFTDFQTAVFNEDAAAFNSFIDSERGVYIIENAGDKIRITSVKDIGTYKRPLQQQSFFTIKTRLQNCELKEEELPVLNCNGQNNDNAGYSKEGCFAGTALEFRSSQFYRENNLTTNETKNIEAALSLIQATVLQTSSSYRFHFGKVNSQWKVFFVDLRMPCNKEI